MIAPAKDCLVGGELTCVTTLLLFVICYDCARKGLPRRGRSDMCYDLIVICYLLFVMIVPATHGNARPVEREKCFTVFCDFTAIARRFHRNRAAIVCQSPFPMFHAACRLVTPTRGNDGSKLAIVCKSISCAKVTGILTPLLGGYDFISYLCNRKPMDKRLNHH